MSVQKGNIPWNKGKKMSEEFKEKCRLRQLGKTQSKEIIKKRKISLKKAWKEGKFDKREKLFGSKNPSKRNDVRIKIGLKHKGKYVSEETKEKLRKNHKGGVPIGFNHSEKTKQILSIKFRGEKSNFWQGGISFEPYSVDWTKTLKRNIKQRDKYTCQVCHKEGNIVHHIDYNKKNCTTNNLITLCSSCHSKTNINRNKWIKYLKEKLK